MFEKPESKRVRVLRKFYLGTETQEIGKIITVPARLASELIGLNKAEYAPEPAKEEIETKVKKEEKDVSSKR